VLSAIFAALTAIFAKVGVANINSDLATFIRTCVILLTLALIIYATGQFQNPASIEPRTYLFLVLSGFATGARGCAISARSSLATPHRSPQSISSASFWSRFFAHSCLGRS
jgi:uncharacterized membrane protein